MTKHLSFLLFSLYLIGIFTFVSYFQIDLSWDQKMAMVAITIAIGLWVGGGIPEYLTSLIFFSLLLFTTSIPAKVIFAGFFSSGFWLIFAGLIIGAGINNSGLGNRISTLLLKKAVGGYADTITKVTFFGMMMAFLMPSAMGRVMLMLPILIAFCDQLGFGEGTKGRSGIIFAGVFGSYLAGFAILPANLPNVIFAGAMESTGLGELIYGRYFALHFPVFGLAKSLILIIVIFWLFKDTPHRESVKKDSLPPISAKEKRLILFIGMAILLWMTDFLHQISPAWIGLGTGILCLLPKIGVVDNKAFMKNANMAPLFYVTGIIGLGAVVNYTGIGVLFAKKIVSILPLAPGDSFRNYGLLVSLSTVLGTATTLPGVPAILTPLSELLSKTAGLPIMSVLMSQVPGFSTFIFPYQAPPIVVAMGLGAIPLRDGTRLCILLSLATIMLLFPLGYLWWRILGLF